MKLPPIHSKELHMTSVRRLRGQGMTEYIVIVALIGVAAIGAYSFLGQSIRGATAGLALEIAGEDAKGGIDEAKKASDEAIRSSQTKATLKEYNASNH
jgi:Flp pilus assembly pilin Flp